MEKENPYPLAKCKRLVTRILKNKSQASSLKKFSTTPPPIHQTKQSSHLYSQNLSTKNNQKQTKQTYHQPTFSIVQNI